MYKYILLALLAFPVSAEWDLSGPGFIDSYPDEQSCIDSANAQIDGSYECRPVTRIEVVTIPPPPTGCNSAWESGLATAAPGETVCVANGVYPLLPQQQITIPGGVTFRAETRGGARFTGGGKDHGTVIVFAGTGSVIDGIQVLHPTGIAAAIASIDSTGSENRIQNSVLGHGGPGSKNCSPVGLSGGGELVDSVIFGKCRYTVVVGNSQPGPVLIEGNIIRHDGAWIEDPNEPNSAIQVYGKADVTISRNIVIDTQIGATPPTDCGDYCIGADIVDGVQVFAHNLLMEGNVATHNSSVSPRDRCLFLATKGGGTVNNVIVRDFFCSHTRAAIGISDSQAYSSMIVERCTTLDTQSDGNSITCADDAIIDWTWENEEMAFDAMCAVGERQSGWCVSGQTLAEYAQ